MTYFGPIWDQKRAETLAHRGHFSRTSESAHNVPRNQVSWFHIKNLLSKWPTPSKIPILHIFL